MTTTKAFLMSEIGVRVQCQFNPTQLQTSKTVNWSEQNALGRDAPELWWNGGGSGEMTLELFLDASDVGVPLVRTTTTLLLLTKEMPLLFRPPWVVFVWGTFFTHQSVITSLSFTYTYFSETGTPLRARASISLRQFDEALLPLQNPTSHTPVPHETHVVTAGETLDRIAAQHYRDSGKWRLLAETNGVTDPSRLVPGTILVIPDLRRQHDVRR